MSLSLSAQEWKCLHVLARCSRMSRVAVAEGDDYGVRRKYRVACARVVMAEGETGL